MEIQKSVDSRSGGFVGGLYWAGLHLQGVEDKNQLFGELPKRTLRSETLGMHGCIYEKGKHHCMSIKSAA